MQKDSKIFIAGHRGLVGSAILKELQSQGYTNLITKTHAQLDLCDFAKVGEFFKSHKPEYVFFCAAKVGGILANNTYRADFIYQNLAMQNALIYNAHQFKVKKLLFLGSSCIYPKNAPQPMSEDVLLTSELEYTNEPYAIAKIAGLKMCESFNLQYGTNFLSVMPTNLYGENDNFDLQNSHVLPALLRKFHLAKLLSLGKIEEIKRDFGDPRDLAQYGIFKDKVEIWGSGKPRREFLHSSDMAKACIFVMRNIDFTDLTKNQKEIKNTHLNIGYGEDISIVDLASLIREIIGFEGEIVFDSSKPDGTMQKLLDSSKLNALGWKPKINLKDGITQVYQSYQRRV
ncbi:GDP-L-fucose synthase family protein [Helicobacter pametensis]|uniref:GDP-L-fucose synthase family protein n=1 Tax=Helicobacter pametensis TaxID=95149 RepID=UPI000481E735|nr:GDP-L-fucose synthase [Helicobacter pametensis]